VNSTGVTGSEATWCTAPSWFDHVTVVPVLIVRLAGLKAKFLITISFDPPKGAGVVGAVATGLCGEVQPDKEQARTKRITHAVMKMLREYEVIVSLKGV
jgi:hypothetical protein